MSVTAPTSLLHSLLRHPVLPATSEVQKLVDAGADVNAPDDQGLPMLLRVLSLGYRNGQPTPYSEGLHVLLDIALAAGADLDAKTKEGRTARELAADWTDDNFALDKINCEAYRRSDPVLAKLLPHIRPFWPKPQATVDEAFKRSFIISCHNGNMDEINYLLHHWPDAMNWSSDGWLTTGPCTGLMAAIAHGGHKYAVAKLLVAHGCDVTWHNERGESALTVATTRKNGSPDFIPDLVAAGANPTNALHAIVNGQPEYANYVSGLTAIGADINALDAGGLPPLLRILSKRPANDLTVGQRMALESFIDEALAAGADLSVTTPEGASVADLAAAWDDTGVAAALIDRETRRRADPYLRENIIVLQRNWPLPEEPVTTQTKLDFIVACRDGNLQLITYMLHIHPDAANWNLGDAGEGFFRNLGGLAAAVTVGDNNLAAVALLLDKGCHPDQRDPEGRTALMRAGATDNNTAVLQKLVDAGADPTKRDNMEQAALDHAIEAGMADNEAILRDAYRAYIAGADTRYEAQIAATNARQIADPNRHKFRL